MIDLVYYHEKSIDEVAHILDVPPATVKTRMFYARKKLAELVKDSNVKSTAQVTKRVLNCAASRRIRQIAMR